MSWIKRHYLKILSVLLVVSSAAAFAYAKLCPLCGGILVPIDTVPAKDALDRSHNLTIWNGAFDSIGPERHTLVCTRCWMAYDGYFHRWERASALPDSFQRPLTSAIRHVPLPTAALIHYRVVYSQYITRGHVAEMVHFWCDNIPDVTEPLRTYAATHKLVWTRSTAFSEPTLICVHLRTEPDI